MNHYVDINIRSVTELSKAFLLNTVFEKLHLELAMAKTISVGVSFPQFNDKYHTLGSCLRVHGNVQELEQLFSRNWISRLRDYAKAEDVKEVPQQVQHRLVRRVQVKSSPARLRKRLMKRHGLTEAEAMDRIPDSVVNRTGLPFINIKSRSSKQQFKLFIEHGPVLDSPVPGFFSAYGLSTEATVPWF